MTDAYPPAIYPQYCFHLSPTVSTWCRLQIKDIHGLHKHPGFEGLHPPNRFTNAATVNANFCEVKGQNVYFHLNHPIKWVRIAGVVVAVESPVPGKRIYTVDDSSGMNIECVRNVPVEAELAAATAASAEMAGTPKADALVDIDIGHVVDLKGSLRVFRNGMQIQIEHMVILHTTEQEVKFWTKLHNFRREVLSKPWHLDKTKIRKCRKEAEGKEPTREKKRVRKGPSSHGSTTGPPQSEDRKLSRNAGVSRSGSTSKRSTDLVRSAGKYDALGL